MLTMADSITPANLPAGYDAYLGYVDGNWPTCGDLHKQFPGKQTVCLTVTGGTSGADGIDCEPGNPDAQESVAWARHALSLGQRRPVIYASVGSPADPGPYSMNYVLGGLRANAIARADVRLLTAHYTTAHICGPATCRLLPVDADGTQYTDRAQGLNGTTVDASLLRDDFFGGNTMVAGKVTVQNDVTYCGKCKGFYYGPEVTTSICPAGGQHSPANAVSFGLLYSE